MTILALLSEIKYASAMQIMGAGMPTYEKIALQGKYVKFATPIKKYCCPIVMMIGTIIWGYGDILVR